jgi:hypothetical protein
MTGPRPMDPFEHFGEQQQSYELLAEHRTALASDAAELARERPEMQTVGLILHADASEAAAFRAALESASGQSFAGKGFLGVVPRELVLQILRTNHPATLDWLENSGGDVGATRKLPLVAVTKSGVRLACVEYDVEA